MQDLFAKFHLFEISALATAITCFGLAALILKYRDSMLHFTWALHTVAVGGWAFFVFIATLSFKPELAHQYWIISHLFGAWIAILTFHPTCLLCNFSYPRLLKIGYIYTLIESLIHILYPKIFYGETKLLFNSINYLQAKPEFLMGLSFWFFLAIISVYLLLKYASLNKTPKGGQVKLFGILMLLGYIGGCSTFLPMIGINFYPVTLFLIPFYVIVQTYVIFKYNFLGLRVALEKSIIYSALITSISILYLIAVVILERFIRNFIGYNSLSITVGLAFALGILVIPLRNKIQYYADKWLFKGTPVEIAQENESLRREVAETEKFKAVAALASGIAHEIKNPLTALNTFLEYFPQKQHDPEFISRFQDIAHKEVGRINSLVNNLLEFAKPSPLSLEDTDVHRLIDDTLELLSNQLRKNNIQVIKQMSTDKIVIKADRNKLEQVFLNLILNAVDAMAEGGTLTISTNLCSSLPAGRQVCHSSVVICVKDTGHGIAPKDLPHIFEPFYTKKQKGTGLGLSIAKDIVEEHGGKILVKSKLSAGTEFIIKLILRNLHHD